MTRRVRINSLCDLQSASHPMPMDDARRSNGLEDRDRNRRDDERTGPKPKGLSNGNGTLRKEN